MRQLCHSSRSNALTVALSVLLLASVALTGAGHARQEVRRGAADRAPLIDVWAPGVFGDAEHRPDRDVRVRYQVNATILFPLFSIPLTRRDDVGFASAAVQEFSTGARQLRTLELFSASFPERARGLNRTGFIREAVGISRDGIRWTAHFGALSTNPETSRQEVALDADESLQSYTVLDGFTNRFHSSNTDAHVVLNGSWSSARQFYATLLPVWRLAEPEIPTQSNPNAQEPDMEPLGFLGILQHSLGSAASDIQRRPVRRELRHPFVHKGELMFLVLTGHRVDTKRQQLYAEQGLVASDATVHRLDFRILDRDEDQVQQFRVWTELPDMLSGSEQGLIFPVEFEFKAKSFLELQGVRVEPASVRYSSRQ